MTRVAYRGSAPIINDLIGGHLPFAVTTLSDLITNIAPRRGNRCGR